jgi:hypothetical protein
MRDINLDGAGFEQTVTLRDAYRIMERFVNDYRARGDTSVSDFLLAYLSVGRDGRTTDPAAADDFLRAAAAILGDRGNRSAR